MNPQELRIGNRVRYEDGNPVQVREIFCHDEGGMPGDEYCINHTILEAYEPILLTPEIVSSVSFSIRDDDYEPPGFQIKLPLGKRGKISIILDESAAYVWSGLGDNESYGFKVECKYVHQFQNLFYSLTGQELEIKL